MIKLATVFSGIGAIEHALDRMNIDHRIVFACDNGDIDILSKEIGMNIDDIKAETDLLAKTINDLQIDEAVDDLYKQQLFEMFQEMQHKFDQILKTLGSLDFCPISVESVLLRILKMESLKKARLNEYKLFLKTLSQGSKEQRKLKAFQVILEITNDFKKDNS